MGSTTTRSTPTFRFEYLALGPSPTVSRRSSTCRHPTARSVTDVAPASSSSRVDGVGYQLVALQLVGSPEDELFVPFRDATNADETYEAGRYLDLAAQDDGTYDLDFNLAYAPFCAYSPAYSCPLPPRENWLNARIDRGRAKPAGRLSRVTHEYVIAYQRHTSSPIPGDAEETALAGRRAVSGGRPGRCRARHLARRLTFLDLVAAS